MTGNKVTVENSTVGGFEYKNEAGEVIGVLGYIYGGYIASSEGEGNITENVVTLTKTTLKGATGVVGGWHSGKGTVTGNHVNLHQSEINSFVIGGHTTGLGDVKENYVFADNTTVNGYVYGGFFNNSTNGGVAIGNQVTLTNVTVKGDGVAGGYNSGKGSEGNESSSTQRVAIGNTVKISNNDSTSNSVINLFVAGGLTGYYSDSPNFYWNINNNFVNLESTAGSLTVNGYVAGGFNQATGQANGNTVCINCIKATNSIRDSAETSKVTINQYVIGGYISGINASEDTKTSASNNTVIIKNNGGIISIGSYVGGGSSYTKGATESSGNSVTIKSENSRISIGSWVYGGLIGSGGTGAADYNTVTLENGDVLSQYVAGAVHQGTGSATYNKVFLTNTNVNGFVSGGLDWGDGQGPETGVTLDHNRVEMTGGQVTGRVVGARSVTKGSSVSDNSVKILNAKIKKDEAQNYKGHVLGGANQAGGNALKNVVLVENSTVDGYIGGGFIEGGQDGYTDNNIITVNNSNVGSNIAAGYNQAGGKVEANNNHVTIVIDTATEGETYTFGGFVSGGIIGKEKLINQNDFWGSGSANLNTVTIDNLSVKNTLSIAGYVAGGYFDGAGTGSANINTVRIGTDSPSDTQIHIGYVLGGFVGAAKKDAAGEVGDVLGNSVLINDSSVDDNVEGGFNQVSGKGNASQNTVQINGTTKITGFVAGAVIGKQSEGNTDGNQVTITANAGSSIAIGGYVAGGFNDGKGHGAVGNIVWLEAASVSTSKLTVDNFVVGGYLRSGEGSTNGNTVVIKNAVVSGPYIAAGLNEGLGQAQNNSVILENADVTGGVTGGRVTAAQTSNRRSLNVANSNIGESSNNYSALVQNNTVNISGKTSVVGWVVGGESLAGNSVTDKPAYIQNNTVVIDDGYVEGRISGGAAVAGNVIGNKVFLNGGTIKGLVYGGTSAGDVKNNVVYLDGRKGIDVTGAWIYGRGRATTGTNGNTLNITNFKGAMQNIGNFDRIDLDLAGLMVREKEPIILLTENQSTNLDNSTIHIHSSRKAIAVTDDSSLADRYEVIKNQSGSLTAFNVVYEKDKLVVCEQGPMEGLYRVEWDGYPDQIGDSIDLVLERVWERPESGAYISNSLAWSRMHMRLHDRFGQAYYIDPFSGEERAAAGWVRQVGSHSHFRAGSDIKTHSRTAVTQIGTDLIRNEFNQDIKSVWGIFVGGLYNRSSAKTYNSAQSRSDGYALGVYGTLYTGNSPDDGFYVDSWLLFGHYNNKLWSDDLANFRYKSNGWVWSVESGYTFPLSQSGSKDFNKLIWTLQPEIQLVWDGVKADTTVDKDTGTRFKQLGTNNVSLRVGARLHANHMNKGLGFIEGNWIHNTKRAGVQMGTGCKYIKGGRNLAEFRAGLEGHVTKNLLGWATVGVQAGQYGYHNETAQIGLKYMF